MWTWYKKQALWLQIVIVIIIAFLLYKLYKFIKHQIEKGNYNAAVNSSQDAITQLAQQGINPTYGEAQYLSWANAFQIDLDGCGGNFETVLQPAFIKMKNDADIYALIKAYGVRTIDKCGILTGDFTGDLSATLVYKYSGVEGMVINGSISDINNILQKNGLTFTF